MDADALKEWQEIKRAQWARVAGLIPGLQFSETRGHFMLRCSTDTFYDEVVIGRLPSLKTYVAPNGEVEIARIPGIDYSDVMVDAIIMLWERGQKAPPLADPFHGIDSRIS